LTKKKVDRYLSGARRRKATKEFLHGGEEKTQYVRKRNLRKRNMEQVGETGG